MVFPQMVREHEDELGTTENQTKMDSIQLRFPNDDLQLDDGKQQVGGFNCNIVSFCKTWLTD